MTYDLVYEGSSDLAIIPSIVERAVRLELGSPRPLSKIRLHGRFGDEPDRRDARGLKMGAALRDARRQGRVLVFVTDTDVRPNDAPREQVALRDRLSAEAGENRRYVAIGLPTPAIECWLLADPSQFPPGTALPARPERELTQRKGKNPAKTVLEQALGRRGHGNEALRAIAEGLDLDRVARACPISFAPFVAELRSLGPPPAPRD